ncbi:MAG: AAA family ATPase [Pseudomonadota bacterium]
MSYLAHFGLDEQPFRLTPDPEFVYWSKQHSRAKSYMESTIWLADGFVVITGEIGSGKTTMLQSFLSELEDDVVYALVSQTQLSANQFLQALLVEFGFKPFKKDKAELLDMLNTYLIEQYAAGKKVVMIVDEAQNLSLKVLEEIRMISGIETHKEKVLRIILAGQPELKDKIESPKLKQLAQRVRLRFHLGPLSRRELEEYIGHRITVAGGSPDELFDDDAIPVIYRYTGGVPRLTNTLCDTAMLCAFADDKQRIDAAAIQVAIEELGWDEARQSYNYDEADAPAPAAKSTASTGSMTFARIDVRSGEQIVESLDVHAGRLIIGRTPDNDIRLASKFVSRHHAQIVSTLDSCVLEDLNSTNGLYIGAKRIKKRVLKDGDRVTIGKHEIVYTNLRDISVSDGDRSTGT